jgi:ABC-type phosphonate transport system ATPase subunit
VTSGRFGALWLVAAGLITGLAVMAFGHVRSGGLVIAGTLVAGALLRLMLPRRPAGGLVVRSRLVDVLFLLGMGLGLFVIVLALDLG